MYLHHFACAECAKHARQPGQHAQHRWDHDRGEVKGLTGHGGRAAGRQGLLVRPAERRHRRSGSTPRPGKQTFTAPPFTVDLALLITEAGPPDIDRDGKPNDVDDDDDNDGVPDAKDAFPLEREEWADADADRIGDNLDADIDGDGKADDLNRNGIPDNEETDWDGDGVPNAGRDPVGRLPARPEGVARHRRRRHRRQRRPRRRRRRLQRTRRRKRPAPTPSTRSVFPRRSPRRLKT